MILNAKKCDVNEVVFLTHESAHHFTRTHKKQKKMSKLPKSEKNKEASNKNSKKGKYDTLVGFVISTLLDYSTS